MILIHCDKFGEYIANARSTTSLVGYSYDLISKQHYEDKAR